MDQTERKVIDDLFDKVRQAEEGSGPRDGEAEALIRRHVGQQPAAPYYMAQAIVVQEQALESAQARIAELEEELRRRPAGGGGFLGSLFGAGSAGSMAGGRPGSMRATSMAPTPGVRQLQQYRAQGGPSFLGGAMQTAMGVAGGMLLGGLIADAFFGNDALAADAFDPAADFSDPGMDAGGDDAGFFDGGDEFF